MFSGAAALNTCASRNFEKELMQIVATLGKCIFRKSSLWLLGQMNRLDPVGGVVLIENME
jgi:hypothetical protein